jgi:hypothetical protein
LRRFVLNRKEDVAGISGTGIVVEGVQFTDGRVALAWLGDRPSLVFWNSIEDAINTHGHGGKTVVEWIDA